MDRVGDFSLCKPTLSGFESCYYLPLRVREDEGEQLHFSILVLSSDFVVFCFFFFLQSGGIYFISSVPVSTLLALTTQQRASWAQHPMTRGQGWVLDHVWLSRTGSGLPRPDYHRLAGSVTGQQQTLLTQHKDKAFMNGNAGGAERQRNLPRSQDRQAASPQDPLHSLALEGSLLHGRQVGVPTLWTLWGFSNQAKYISSM